MDIHPDRDIVATGARAAPGKRAEVLVWRASTQEVLARLGGVHRNAVTALKFSPNGKKLVTVGQDREHALVVYDWANQSVLAATSTGAGKVTAAAWKTEGEFMTVGTSYTMFYTMNGKNLSVRRGHAEGELQRDHCCVYAYEGALCLTGNESGSIYQWDGSAKLLGPHRAHDAPVQ
jgi:WD40 repeat protein